MIQWMNPGTRRACPFAALLAVLAGCNDGGDKAQTPPESTFAIAEPVDDTKVPEEPVVGVVTAVPSGGTTPASNPDAPPTSGTGELAGPDQIVVPAPDSVVVEPAPPVPLPPHIDPPGQFRQGMEEPFFIERATRFTQIAPATNDVTNIAYDPSATYEYMLGNLVAMEGGKTLKNISDDRLFIAPVKGWIRFPEKAKDPSATKRRFPVIVFEHGMGAKESYKGYDYLAADLAAQGYVVISINADRNNDAGDRTSQSRAQLLLGTLDRFRQIDKDGQINGDGSSGALNPLKGKLDFTSVGIMGHSRGGQGVAAAIKLNLTRLGTREADLKTALKIPALPKSFDPFSGFPDLRKALNPTTTVSPADMEKDFQAAIKTYNIFYAAGADTAPHYDFGGAFMLAPTNSENILGLNNVPLAVLLPSCDGDVSNLEGARAYDHNRFGPKADIAPRYQILVHGANHDFYNRIWGDDGEWSNPQYCDDTRAGSIRLSRPDQERNGLFLINSFMRYHVGGEQKFAAYWNGTAQLPKEACQVGVETCDERVILTVQKDFGHRKLIQRFDQADSMLRNQHGGSTKFTGFDETNGLARCTMPVGPASADWIHVFAECTDMIGKSTDALEGFRYVGWGGKGFLSIADHAELAWSKPSAAITTDLTGISAAGTDSLTFRIAVVRPVGQEVLVTLTDNADHAWTVTASDFSDALYNTPRRKKGGNVVDESDLPMADHPDDTQWIETVPQLLNMVAVPLKAFEGVDMTGLKELKLVFPRESGKVAITDIQLQNLGRDKPQQKLAAKQ